MYVMCFRYDNTYPAEMSAPEICVVQEIVINAQVKSSQAYPDADLSICRHG